MPEWGLLLLMIIDNHILMFVLYGYMKTVEKSVSVTRLGASRQVAIPKKLHDEMGLQPGDYFEVVREDDRLVFKPKVLIDKSLREKLDRADLAYKQGKYAGPFKSASVAVRAVKQYHARNSH